MFKRVLVANRGEIALRVIRACKELGVEAVAVYSTADTDSMHVQLANSAICIGPGPSSQSYLKMEAIISAAEIANVDAIHPGYGFLSENPKFAKICESCKIKFIGPSAEVIAMMGDKSTAKATAARAGVPVTPGSKDIVRTEKEAIKIAEEMGYPVMIKATAGGGGRGMRPALNEASLKNGFNAARAEAEACFGNPDVYIEKFIVNPHHIEFQIVADSHGNVVHLGERDCSLQRRNQKIIEECPSPILTPELRKRMGDASVQLCKEIGYENCGTIEYLVDDDGNFYFMEMNTRIQVEHPITEEVTNFDLIKEQIQVAAGIPISGKNYFPEFYAMECRINAEDPANGFRPSPGKITNLNLPGGHGVRVDTHIYAGYTIPPNYDSMVAKLIVTARTREEVIVRMKRALSEFVIEGVKTTIPFHLRLMDDPQFQAGKFTTKFLETFDFSNLQ